MAIFAADNFRPPDTLICPSRANPPRFVHCALYDDRGTIPVSLQFRPPGALWEPWLLLLLDGTSVLFDDKTEPPLESTSTEEMLYDMARTLSPSPGTAGVFFGFLCTTRFVGRFL